MKKKSLPEVDHFAHLVGEFIQYWGFKRIHGKIWTHIFLSQNPIGAKELMQRLDISKALVSLTLKDLLEYQVIFEQESSSYGTKNYRANPDLRTVIQQVLRSREKILMGKIKSAASHLHELSDQDLKDYNVTQKSIKDISRLIKNGEKILSSVIKLL